MGSERGEDNKRKVASVMDEIARRLDHYDQVRISQEQGINLSRTKLDLIGAPGLLTTLARLMEGDLKFFVGARDGESVKPFVIVDFANIDSIDWGSAVAKVIDKRGDVASGLILNFGKYAAEKRGALVCVASAAPDSSVLVKTDDEKELVSPPLSFYFSPKIKIPDILLATIDEKVIDINPLNRINREAKIAKARGKVRDSFYNYVFYNLPAMARSELMSIAREALAEAEQTEVEDQPMPMIGEDEWQKEEEKRSGSS